MTETSGGSVSDFAEENAPAAREESSPKGVPHPDETLTSPAIDLTTDDEDTAEAGDIEIDLGADDPSETPDVEIDLLGDEPDTSTDEPADINLDFGADDEQPVTEPQELEQLVEAEAGAEPAEEAPDEDLEKALEELRAELRAKPGDWYVVHTYSGMEKRVKQNLESRVTSMNMEDFIFEVRVPTEEITEIRGGQKKKVTRTVLPGYVLVCMDLTDESWSTVRHTPSVTGFVGHATSPVPLGLDEVEKMLAPAVVAKVAAASEGQAKPARKKKVEVADFSERDSVMIIDGPFSGVHATINEINANNQTLKVSVEILGRETPVELTFSQIQKL